MDEVTFRFGHLLIIVWPRFDRAALLTPLGPALNLTTGELTEAVKLALDAKGKDDGRMA